MKKPSLQYVRFEDSSVLRKFTILFILMSLTPMSVLYYFYHDIKSTGNISISLDMYSVMLIFVILGILLGFFKMRSILVELINLVHANRKAMENILTPDQIEKIKYDQNEISVLAASFSQITAKLDENVKSLQVAKKTLHTMLNKIGHGISNMQNIDTFLELIMETVTDAMNAKEGVLILIDKGQESFTIKTVYGHDYQIDQSRIPLDDQSVLNLIIKTKSPVIVNAREVCQVEEKMQDLIKPPLICAPLILREKVVGIIIISGSVTGHNFKEEDKGLLQNLASQTAIAIQNAELNRNMEKTYFETISALALAVDAKDKYSRGHLDRVAGYCMMIADKLGLDQEDARTLRDAARLHDIGKIGVPDSLLTKEGTLTADETEMMRRHPEIGESIIKPISSLAHLCDLIRHHHEKLDGTGYPDGLNADEISPLVRILAIADIFDALTTSRPYRSKMSHDKACSVLREMKTEIDQDIVEVFIEALETRQG